MRDLDAFIEEIATKYGYEKELADALKRILPVMIEGQDEEGTQLIFDTLERVPIFLFDKEPTQEQVDELTRKQLNGRNTHVKIEEHDSGEYDKFVAPAGYITKPIFDEDMNLIDRMGAIYLTKLPKYSELLDTYNTSINLSYLIHELGHAVASQKDEYIQEEDGSLIQQIGALRSHYAIDRNLKTCKSISQTGLFVEEALNTIEEERILCSVLNVDSYKAIPHYIPSKYQGLITSLMRSYTEILGEEPFYDYRMKKDEIGIRKAQEIFDKVPFFSEEGQSTFYKKKEELLLSFRNTVMSDKSKGIVEDFFEEYKELYFSANGVDSGLICRLDRVLEQLYNFASIRYRFDFMNKEVSGENGIKISDAYTNIAGAIYSEGKVPLLQAERIMKEKPRPITLRGINEYKNKNKSKIDFE